MSRSRSLSTTRSSGRAAPGAHTTSGTSSCATRSTTAFPRRSEGASTSGLRRSEPSWRVPRRSTRPCISSWRGIVGEAFRTALVGARAAAAVSSHREALDLYRRVTRNMPEETDPLTRARIQEELATEAAAMDQNEAAAAAFESARELYRAAGAALQAAAIVAPLVSIRHLLGIGTEVGAAARAWSRGARSNPAGARSCCESASLVAALASALARDLRIVRGQATRSRGDRARGPPAPRRSSRMPGAASPGCSCSPAA